MRVTEQATFAKNLEEASPHKNAKRGRPEPALRLVEAEPRETADIFGSRLAVILAADVADYTRHMAKDEVGTHARFACVYRNFVQPGIARHGARIVKNTGDGFMAEFWSATRAVWF